MLNSFISTLFSEIKDQNLGPDIFTPLCNVSKLLRMPLIYANAFPYSAVNSETSGFLIICRVLKIEYAARYWKILKVGLSPSKKTCVICFIERSLKMMKNAFYFILKALFVHKIFKFLS